MSKNQDVEITEQRNGSNGQDFHALHHELEKPEREWSTFKKIAFRIAFPFFLLMCIPLTGEWYKHLINIDWTNLHYRDIYDICRFPTFSFVEVSPKARWGIGGYANWGVTFLIAVGIGLVWTFIDKKRKQYEVLNYWLRVIVRYRAALGIIGFGFTKLLPVQMPYPSQALLNGDFGDFTEQKIYWMSIGIVPWYQIFTGVVEVAAGAMLLFRKTASWGAALLVGTLGTIVVVNLAYDGGVHVYSSFFVLLGAYLLITDVKNAVDLLVFEKVVVPVKRYHPLFAAAWQKYGRIVFKTTLIFVFIILFFYLQVLNFLYDPYKQPSLTGVKQLRGNYNVTEFRLNNKLIPYTPFDTVRWQEATFEKWTTLTYKVNKPVQIDLSNGGGDPMKDISRTFEVSGVGGGRRTFYYDADTKNNVLYLQDKNIPTQPRNVGPGGDVDRKKRAEAKDSIYPENWISTEALANIGDNALKLNPKVLNTRRIEAYKTEKDIKTRRKMVLHYTVVNDGARVILTGTDENRDSIYVVLDKVKRDYVVSESSLKAGVYE
jgi:hypothetical protein